MGRTERESPGNGLFSWGRARHLAYKGGDSQGGPGVLFSGKKEGSRDEGGNHDRPVRGVSSVRLRRGGGDLERRGTALFQECSAENSGPIIPSKTDYELEEPAQDE